MNELIRNLKKGEPFALLEQVDYKEGQIVTVSAAQKDGVAITIFAFDAGEGVSTHAAPGDAMANVLEGELDITVGDRGYRLKAGESIVMPYQVPHSVTAVTRAKMFLVVVKETA